MPGVPSGRGCDACRKQKKKCDNSTTPCVRCKRLNIPCVGAGKQRFKFVNDDKFTVAKRSSSKAPVSRSSSGNRLCPQSLRDYPSSSSNSSSHEASIVFYDLCNEHTRLVHAFTDKIKPSVGVEYNFAFTYGTYLTQIPARLGTNKALDAAVDVLLAAHERFSPSYVGNTVVVLEKYNKALSNLRTCLDDPVKATSSETLCAVILLMTCQMFIYTPTGVASNHGEGIAQIVKMRRRPDGSDPLESYMLLSLRAIVLFESLFNERISFTDEEWIDMFDTHEYALEPEGKAVQCLTKAPNLMRRIKALLGDPAPWNGELERLQEEAQCLRDDLEPQITSVRERWSEFEKTAANTKKDRLLNLMHCHAVRTYALVLAIAIFINEIKIAIFFDSTDTWYESYNFAVEILELSKLSQRWQPLGSCAMSLCMMAAVIAARETPLKAEIEKMRFEYARGLRGPNAGELPADKIRLICSRESVMGTGFNYPDSSRQDCVWTYDENTSQVAQGYILPYR